jgi:hypothetical protein
VSFARVSERYSDPLELLEAALKAGLDDVFIDVNASELPENLQRRRGVFVTLIRNGAIRGCMGTFWPLHKNAGRELIWSGLQAAFNDVRFAPLGRDELDGIEAVVDLIDSPQQVSVDELQASAPVLAQIGDNAVVLLPLDGMLAWPDVVAAFGGPGSKTSASVEGVLAELTHPLAPGEVVTKLLDNIDVSQPPVLWAATLERYKGRLRLFDGAEAAADYDSHGD